MRQLRSLPLALNTDMFKLCLPSSNVHSPVLSRATFSTATSVSCTRFLTSLFLLLLVSFTVPNQAAGEKLYRGGDVSVHARRSLLGTPLHSLTPTGYAVYVWAGNKYVLLGELECVLTFQGLLTTTPSRVTTTWPSTSRNYALTDNLSCFGQAKGSIRCSLAD